MTKGYATQIHIKFFKQNILVTKAQEGNSAIWK